MGFCFIWLICGAIGYAIGESKRAGGTGCLLGLLFGPLGCILAFFADNRPLCPWCRGRLPQDGLLCLHCRQPLEWRGAVPLRPDEAIEARQYDAQVARMRTQQMRATSEAAERARTAFRQNMAAAGARLQGVLASLAAVAWELPGQMDEVIRRVIGEENSILIMFVWIMLSASFVFGAGLGIHSLIVYLGAK